MHHVFLVNEIFKIICEHLTEMDGGTSALIALAQSCRSLNEISLDVLWGTDTASFIDILKTLPSDSWSYRDSFSLERPISPSEIKQLGKYTARVTNLQVRDLDVQTFETLIHSHKSCDWLALWPKVRTLWWIADSETLPFLEHFLTTDVRSLKINFEGAADEECQEALCLVESRCMNLEWLHLSDSESRDNQELQDIIRQVIYNNSLTLRRFMPPQDPSAELVSDALQLDYLECLEMHIPEIPDLPPSDISSSLRSLCFTLNDPTDIVRLLGTLNQSKLQHFDITCPYPESKEERVILADFFKDSGLYNSLTAFIWALPSDVGPLTRDFVTIVEPFANLQSLQLENNCGSICAFRFGHNDVIQVSQWMPRLRELIFGGSPCALGGLGTDIGYQTLYLVARNCPNLHWLTVHFNIRTLVPFSCHVEPNAEVTMWDVGATVLPRDPGARTMIALAISKLFPKTSFAGPRVDDWLDIYQELRCLTLPPVHKLLDLS